MEKKAKAFLLLAALSIILSVTQVFAADKLGYVNLGLIFNDYNKTKEYDKSLEGKQKDFESERDKKAGEIKALQDKLALLNEKEKAKAEESVKQKIEAFKEDITKKTQDLRKERDEKLKEILGDIEKAVRQYAEAQGYTLVFNDRVLIYQVKDYDLTDKVTEIVNKNYPAKK